MRQANRLATNLVVTLGRMVFTVWLGLLTTRLTYQLLGKQDYGLYAAVGAVVAMLPTLIDALMIAGQRHLAWALGEKDRDGAQRVFSTLFFVYVALVAALLPSAALLTPLVVRVLDIPPGREGAAAITYLFVLATTAAALLNTPFRAAIAAQQRFVWMAVLDVILKLLNLAFVVALFWVSGDRLIWFAGATAALYWITLPLGPLVLWRIDRGFVPRPKQFDRAAIRALLSFAGWAALAAMGFQLRLQSVAILLNIGYGTTVSAAFAIAIQAGMYVYQMPVAIAGLIAPAITGLLAQQRVAEAARLSLTASKLMTLLGLMLSVPICLDTDLLLRLWLGEVPPITAPLVALLALTMTAVLLTGGSALLIQGTGHLRGLTLAQLSGEAAAFAIACAVVATTSVDATVPPLIMLVGVMAWSWVAVPLLARSAGLPVINWIRAVVLRLVVITVLATAAAWMVRVAMPDSAWRLAAVFASFAAASGVALLVIGLTRPEREQVGKIVGSLLRYRPAARR